MPHARHEPEDPAMPVRLTEKRLRILRTASDHPLGLVTRPYLTGFERVSWDRNATTLQAGGLLAPYVHGGFEITPAGRAVLERQARRTADAGRTIGECI